jgi:hypothetical protein
MPFIVCFARTSEFLAASNAERSSSELSESSLSSSESCIIFSDEALLDTAGSGTFSFCGGDTEPSGCSLAASVGLLVGWGKVLDEGSLAGGGDTELEEGSVVGGGDRLEVYPR